MTCLAMIFIYTHASNYKYAVYRSIFCSKSLSVTGWLGVVCETGASKKNDNDSFFRKEDPFVFQTQPYRCERMYSKKYYSSKL